MSLSLNQVTLAGRLTRDVELRDAGTSKVASIGMAVNRKFKDGTGAMKEETVFIDLEAWGKTAEHCAQYLAKGSPIYVDGRLKLDEWKTKDGQKRQTLKVVANRVDFLGDSIKQQAPTERYAASPDAHHALTPARPAAVAAPTDFGDEPPF